jgi:ketosteroid isomerase-like protein
MYLSTNLARHHLAPGDRQNHPSGQVHHFWLGKPLVSHYTWVITFELGKITSFLGEIPFNFCQINIFGWLPSGKLA